MMDIATALAGLNIVVLVTLIYVYGRIAMRSRSPTSIGLIVFASLLLAHNLLTIYAYATMAPFFGAGVLPYLSGISILELAALLILLRMTL